MTKETIMQTVTVNNRTIEQIINDATTLFENGQTVICISGQMKNIRKIKEVIDILEQKGCSILDKHSEAAYSLFFVSHPQQ